jgi:hypothetical protein
MTLDNLKFLELRTYEGASKSFRTESIKKYKVTAINTQTVMTAKLTRLTHELAIQLHLVAEGSTTCSSFSRRPVRIHPHTPNI